MKNIILTLFAFLFVMATYGQTSEDIRIEQLNAEIQTALAAEDYEKAAALKKEKEFNVRIREEVQKGDYEQAAVIKKEMEAFLNGEESPEINTVESNGTSSEINVADLNLKVGGMQTEEFLYGFCKGDKIVFSFNEESEKEMKEIEVLQYSGSSKFKSFKTANIKDKIIEVQETGIYIFRFSNGTMAKRVCQINIKRIPASSQSVKFNTAVYWKTVYDTSYYTEQEKYLISKDTVVHNITDQTAKVHSSGNLNGNKTSFNFTLPKNTVVWSYYVGVNQEGQEALEKAATELSKNAGPILAKMPGYGPLAALALGATPYLTRLQSGEDIDFYIVDGNNVNLFLGGNAFNYIKKGKVINDFSKMTAPTRGSYHFCFANDNAVTGVTVVVQITAIAVTENWGERPIEKMKVESREVAYLKN